MLVRHPFLGAAPKDPSLERAAGAPQRGERAGSGFVWFQKCTLLTAGSPPPRRPSRTGGRRVTAGGGGRGRGPDGEGWGARASSPFLWNKGKSVSEASVTPGRAKTVRRVGLATRRKFVRAGTPGPGVGPPSLLRGLCASPVQGGDQHGVWAQSWGGGGRRGGWSPAPSLPLPLRAEFGAQSRARTFRRPRAPRVSLRGEPGKGLGTKLFPAPEWTREFSFLQSFPPPGGDPAEKLLHAS